MIQYGIVIRNNVLQKKVWLLDSFSGTVPIFFKKNVCLGGLLTYHLEHNNNRYVMHKPELIALPNIEDENFLLFFHHVLELCFHFVPTGSCAPEIFNLVKLLYSCDSNFTTRYAQHIFLCKLFTLLGLIPEQLFVQKKYNEQQVTTWLKRCIAQHPLVHEFKTTHFLDMQ